MTMPELPRRIKRREADFGLRFRSWIASGEFVPMGSATFELKDSRGTDAIPFNAFELKQRRFAERVSTKEGELVRVTVGTPGASDYIFLKGAQAFVVANFPSGFFVISAKDFITEATHGKRKSLTSKRAQELAIRSVLSKRKQ